MAVVHRGDVSIFTETQGSWAAVVANPQPLQLSSFNFTQLVYPVFGVGLFHYLVKELRSVADLKRTVNILVWGSLVTAGFSFVAGILFTIGLGSAYWGLLGLFTVGPVTGVGAPEAGFLGQFFRTYTPAGEPGFTALTLLVGIGLLLGAIIWRSEDAPRTVRMPRLKVSVLAFALLLNGSTTGYFGAFLLLLWALIAPLYVGSTRSVAKPFFYSVGAIAILGVAGSMIQVSGLSFYEWIMEYHLAKIQGEAASGSIRFYVTWYTLTEVFPVSPFLGVGYGSHLSLSLATFLLANIGLIGFGAFLAFLFVVLRNATTAVRRGRGAIKVIAFSAVLLFVPFFATLFVAKATSSINYGVTWMIIALAEASHQVYRHRMSLHSP